MRASAGLDADDELARNQPAGLQPLGVLRRDEVVRDHGDAQAISMEQREEPFEEARLPGADRAADADPDGAHLRT